MLKSELDERTRELLKEDKYANVIIKKCPKCGLWFATSLEHECEAGTSEVEAALGKWMPMPELYGENERDDERVGALIDVIEDFLAERGVRLPESVEDDTVRGGAVVICGGDYDALASRIEEFFGGGHEL